MRTVKNLYFAYRSFWPEIETMKRFRECGVDTFMFMVSNVVNSLGTPYTKYPPVWKWNGVFDLDALDRQIGDILDAIPDARLICMVDLNTPQWWTRYLGAFGARYDSFYELGKVSACPTWRRDTAEYLQTVLRHAEKRYSSHLAAYVLGCGGATEWHDRSRGEESVYRLAAWRRWLRGRGLPPADIPGRMERDAGGEDFDTATVEPLSYFNGIDPTGCYAELFPKGFGLMRTPGKNRTALDYWRFCNDLNADTALFFLAAAREVVRPEAELGMFFGYAGGYWMMNSGGHLAYERLLESPDIDFVMAPIGYVGRGMGRASASVTVRETIRLKGKRMLQEMDQRTYTCNRKLAEYFELPDPLKKSAETVEWTDPTDSREQARKFSLASDGVWKNDDEIVAGMKRDAAFALINGDSLWWFDMWGGFYRGERVFAALRRIKEIWDEQSVLPRRDIAEVLMVLDPENMLLVNDMDARCGRFHERRSFGASGIPYTACSFNDLARLDMVRFRLVVLCHPFVLDAPRRDALERLVLRDGRTVLWFYGPGVIEDGRWDPANVARVCGTPFGAPGVNVAEMDGWTSVYVHDPRTLAPEALRTIALDAGCHAYTAEARPVCADDRLVSVHTGTAETLEVRLRAKCARVVELYSGRVFRDTDRVLLTSSGPDTFLLLLEPAGDGGSSGGGS